MKKKLFLAFLAVMLLSAIGIAVGLWLQPKPETPGPGQGQIVEPGGQLPENQTGTGQTGGDNGQPLPATPDNTVVPQSSNNPPAPSTPAPTLNVTGSLVSTASLGRISLGSDNKTVQFYDSSAGYFYGYQNGEKKLLSSKQFPQATEVVWDRAGNKAYVVYSSGKAIIDFKNNKQIDLPPEVESVSFSASGEQIVFKTNNSNFRDNYLAVMSIDGGGVKFIEPIGDKGADVQSAFSPNNQVVAFFRKGVSAERQEIYFLGQNNENFKAVPVPGRGFVGSWSPDGQQVLYQVHNLDTRFTPRLYVMGGSGDNIGSNNRSLSLATVVDKCVWQNITTVLCGVPRSLPEGSGYLPKLLDEVPDSLYKIDLTTGLSSFIGWPQAGSQDLSVKNPVVSADGKIMYFTDGLSGSLISIPLP